MRLFLSLFLSLILLLSPVAAESSTFVAVFSDQVFIKAWNQNYGHKIDLLYSAKSWKDLSIFLRQVATKAEGRPILIDICVHGVPMYEDKAFFYLGGDLYTQCALIKQINSTINPKKVEAVVEETCFAGNVYRTTMTGNNPPYLIYGVENYPELVTLSLESYQHKNFCYLKDLRIYRDIKPGLPIMKDPKNPARIFLDLQELSLIYYLLDHH